MLRLVHICFLAAVFSSATQFEVTDGMQGEFSCQARNLAGLGTRCDVKVFLAEYSPFLSSWIIYYLFQINGPVAALVAETDFSFLMFGGGLVIFVFIVITTTIVICRHNNKLSKKIIIFFPFNDLIKQQVNMLFHPLINSIIKIAKIQSQYFIIVQVCWWKRRQNGGKYDVTIIHEVQEDFTIKHREEKNGIPKKRKKISNDIIDKNVTRNPPPKILTARKRTKNGVLKKPTELWLV